MDIKDIRVFICVPGVGKTHLCNMDNRFVDMDNEKAFYKYDFKNLSSYEFENKKGNRGSPINNNSAKYIKNLTFDLLTNTNKILLYAPNPQIVEMIYDYKIPYCLVYHSLDCISEYKIRMKNRGNTDNFIESMLGDSVIYNFYNASLTDKRPSFKIELKPKQYLSDVLLNIFKIS